jgi:hypothetical protein
MKQEALVLDRYRGKAGPEPCVCCGAEYTGGGELCHNCKAPQQISNLVRSRGTPPRFVPVLGASGAGKTVYLGMLLDILSKGLANLQGSATDPSSVAIQEDTMAALERRRFPEKTATEADQWRWVHCEVVSQKRPKYYLDLVTPDFAGEAIANELERPGTYPAIHAIMQKAYGVLMLCDSVQVRDAGFREDVFAVKLASYIYNAHITPAKLRRRQPATVPLAFVFTKADCCSEAQQDPERFAIANMPRVVQLLKKEFANFRFFAASVVGSTAALVNATGFYMTSPLHVQPHGITEPFEWLLNRS